MPLETGYTSQVAPQAAPGPVQASPAAEGAGVAQAMGQFGDTIHSDQLRAYQLDRQQQQQSQAADFYHKMAQTQVAVDAQMNAIRSNPNLSPQDRAAATQQVLSSQPDNLFSGITERSVQNMAQEHWDNYSAGIQRNQADWAEGQRIGKLVTDTTQTIGTLADHVNSSPDPDTFNHALQTAYGLVGALQLPPDAREKFAHEAPSQLMVARILGLSRGNGIDRAPDPDAALALLNSPADSFLLPGQKEVLMHSVLISQHQQQGRIAAAQRAAIAGLNVQADDADRAVKAGANVTASGAPVDLEHLRQLRQQIQQVSAAKDAAGTPDEGLHAKLDLLSGAIEQVNVNAKLGSAPPQVVAQQAQVAEAEIQAAKQAGKPVSPAQAQQATALRVLADRLNEQANSDPISFATNLGIPLAPLNPNNPASFQQRASQAQQIQQAQKIAQPISPLTKDEAAALGKAVASGDGGRMDVLRQLDNFDPNSRALAARQILPNDGTFAAEAQISGNNRAIVQAGRERLAANSGFWNVKPDGSGPAPAPAVLSAADQQVDMALRLIPPSDAAGVKATMRNWLAGLYAGQGRADGSGVTQHDTMIALKVAMGGQMVNGQLGGGVAYWGNPHQPFALPETMTSGQFGNAVVRQRMADDKAGHGPVNPDGTPLNLNNATPVFAGGNSYHWMTDSGVVKTRGGQPYVMTLGQH